jgi:hypothetical protein
LKREIFFEIASDFEMTKADTGGVNLPQVEYPVSGTDKIKKEKINGYDDH